MDLHHNLFYGYRGPSTDEGDRERQLENNLTKALINTLKLGGEAVWRPFLANVGLANVRSAGFLLQRRDLPSGGAATRKHRILLGISKEKSVWAPTVVAQPEGGSIPDGWVHGDGFAVLIESKVNGDFLPSQMQAHLALLRPIEGTDPQIILTTWGQIHTFFAKLQASLTDRCSCLLATQFTQFLEYSGMTGFTGFRREHFDYFVLHDDDDARCWVRDQVDDFASQILASLSKSAPFYDHFDRGTLKTTDSYCWVAFGPTDYRSKTHQTISLAADGLRVFVNAELKAATDHIKAVVTQSGATVRAELNNLHKFEPFDLALIERIQRQASLYDYTPKIRLHSSMLADEETGDVAWEAFAQTIQRLPLFQLCIERLVPPPRLLDFCTSDSGNVVQYVVNMLEHNHSVVKLFNE